jgi:hypothetical protein
MSYAEFLNRKKINSPDILDTRMKFSDASSYIWRARLAASSISRPTDHVITNVSDPSIVPNLTSKKPTVYAGTGYGGRVGDASSYTATLGATAIGRDSFGPTKIMRGAFSGTNLTTPPASQVVNGNGNADGKTTGLNMGYTETCAVFTPQTKSYFVDTIPVLATNKIGVSAVSGSSKGVQLPITCSTTSTTGAAMNADGSLATKDEKPLNIHSLGPKKTDFLTAITGPQVSRNGAGVRAPKVGGALDRPKYVEKHHGRAWGPRPYPNNGLNKFVPPTGAPAQLKINSPQHYHVA